MPAVHEWPNATLKYLYLHGDRQTVRVYTPASFNSVVGTSMSAESDRPLQNKTRCMAKPMVSPPGIL